MIYVTLVGAQEDRTTDKINSDKHEVEQQHWTNLL